MALPSSRRVALVAVKTVAVGIVLQAKNLARRAGDADAVADDEPGNLNRRERCDALL
jgi:hypothetical protein